MTILCYLTAYIKIKNYIKQLKNGCVGGLDCLVSEHFKFGLQTKLPLILSYLFTGCIRFGVLPTAFSEGLLVLIIIKPNLDPGLPNNYRLITISSVCSKLLEYYILDKCSDIHYDSSQFGFITNRNTNMAAALAHDVSAFCVASGSLVYFCSLAVKGAFDCIPHHVLFDKALY